MAFVVTRKTCGTTSSVLKAGDQWKALDLTITASAACYIGPTGVTTANGFALTATNVYKIRLAPGESLYCVGAAGTEVISVLANEAYGD